MSSFMHLTVWTLLLLPDLRVAAESKCKNKFISSIKVTAELQADVLLPCNFGATLLGSNKTADIAAVWSQRNITADNLLEIKLQGEVMFWNNRDKRIKPFPKLSESGNFSILLRNVQQSDMGLYHCELYEEFNCMIAYQEVLLKHAADGSPAWPIIPGALGGGTVLLALLIAMYFCAKRKRNASCKTTCNNLHLFDMHTAIRK
ncbi:hypothetical protein MHYP_G00282670 [Metynnis hypsauchen]